MTWTHRPKKAKPTAPTSGAFPLDWHPTRSDLFELQANLIEAAAYVVRHRWHGLRADKPLSSLCCLVPELATKPIGDMSAAELETLVDRLRAAADRERAKAAA